jgi:hypothetical protein
MEVSQPSLAGKAYHSQLANILKLIFDIYWWGTAVLTGFSVIFILGLYLIGPASMPFPFPVSFSADFMKGMDLKAHFTELSYQVSSADGNLIALLPAKDGAKVLFMDFLPSMIASLWIAYLLRGFFRAVRDGRPFDPGNPKRIRIIGFVIIANEIFQQISSHLLSAHLVPLLKTTITGLSTGREANMAMLFIGLIVIALAQVFELGGRIQREQELTI